MRSRVSLSEITLDEFSPKALSGTIWAAVGRANEFAIAIASNAAFSSMKVHFALDHCSKGAFIRNFEVIF